MLSRKCFLELLYILMVVELVISKENIDCANITPFIGQAHPYKCCPIPEFYTPEIFDECKDNSHQTKGSKKAKSKTLPNPLSRGPCFTHCAFNATGIIDAEQKLNETALENYLDNAFEHATRALEWKSHALITFKQCFDKNSAFLEQATSDETCSPFAENLARCFGFEAFKNCPKKIWKGNDVCNQMHDYIMQCNFTIF